ncbi:MAG: PKD domain-containing protein [Flammeovirgaceae bacterium]|jgi:hypothetical protein|nr:PKD domain-containing protein [Flammeovirgaceae bacterium]
MKPEFSRARSTQIIAIIFFIIFCSTTLAIKAQSVDMLTGRLEMSIPLGKLEANDISIPISVYHSGGSLRVAEGEGDCGMGWNLSAGGGITRLLKGLPDEVNTSSKRGWLYVHTSDNKSNAGRIQSFVPSSDDAVAGSCDDEIADWNFLEAHLDSAYVNDTEPDIFLIDAPGLSAKFVFDANGTPQVLSAQDLIIVPNFPDGFTVKTNNGLVYSFANQQDQLKLSSWISKNGNRVQAECMYFKKYGQDQVTSMTFKWNLVSITSSKTGTNAAFSYLPTAYEGGAKKYHSSDSLHFLLQYYYATRLANIALKSYSVNFSWAGSLLSQVEFMESNSLVSRKINFDYASATNSVSQTNKSFLQRIILGAGYCLPRETYRFEYLDVDYFAGTNNVPNYINWKNNWQQDYFGYPNVTSSPNKNLPRLYFYSAANNENRLRVDGITPGYQFISGDDRSAFSATIFGVLKKIVYPTGGVTEIGYEKNFYFDSSVNSELFGGGARVKKITTNGGEAAFGKTIETTSQYRSIVKEYEYKDASGTTSSGRLLSPIKLGYILHDSIKQAIDNMGEHPVVLYSRVKEKITGKGYMIYEYNLPGMFPETANGEWKATKTRIARKPQVPCLNGGYLRTGFYLYPYAPSSNYEFRRGTIARVTTYSEAGTLIAERVNTYTTLTKNPSIIKGLRFEKMADIYHFGLYEILTGRSDVVSQEVVKEASQEDPTKWIQTTTSYAYGANNMLRSVTTSLPNGTIMSKYLTYAKDFVFTAPADTAAIALKALNDANRGSELVEEISYLTVPGSAQTVINANLITHRVFENGLVLPYYVKASPPGVVITPAFASGQNFAADTDYRQTPTMTFKEYDSEGRVLTQVGDKRNWSAVHYAKDISAPIASIANARAGQCIIENFEMPVSFGLYKSDVNFHQASGWTGDKSIAFINNTSKLVSSPTELIQKNGNRYRVSCWVYGLQNKTVTFTAKVGMASVASIILTNPIANKWNYLEGEMNTSAISAPFLLEVTTNASLTEKVTIDDIVFVPSASRVSLQTTSPFSGVSSTSDDLGNSTKVVYDHKGRRTQTLDRFRNLVEKYDYAVKNEENPEPIPSFIPGTEEFFVNVQATFAPSSTVDPCDPSTTFSWQVDGIGQSSGANNTLYFTFTTAGVHNIKLTVTNSAGISRSHTETICVQYLFSGTYSVELRDQNGNPISSYNCLTSPIPQIHEFLVGPTNLPEGCKLVVKWKTTVDTYATSTVTNYIASYYWDCSAFDDCFLPALLGEFSTASASVTYVQLTNCP